MSNLYYKAEFQMITDNHRKESLSISYVQAIAGKAGLIISVNDGNFDYGVDGRFSKVLIEENEDQKKEYSEVGFPLCFQLKASSNFKIEPNYVRFVISTKAYNKIVSRNNARSLKLILIAFCIPDIDEKWLEVTEENLIINKACYWIEITDKDKKPLDSSVTLHIPRKNLLTADELNSLMDKVQREESLL